MKPTSTIIACSLIVLASWTLMPLTAVSQCSDGGVCTIGHTGSAPTHRLDAGYSFGKSKSEDDITYQTIGLRMELTVFDDSHLQVALPFAFQSGPLGTVSGIGDVIVLWAQQFMLKGKQNLEFHAGARLATAAVNEGGLPQRYQSGLGTTDLLFGLSYGGDTWNAAIGYQFSRGRSLNSIDRLRRGDDLLIRGGYRYQSDRWTVSGELIAIKRLHLSSVRDTTATASESFVDVPDSDQLQVNILARPSYRISDELTATAQIAVPLLDRTINVDGLTRVFSISAGLSYNFSFSP